MGKKAIPIGIENFEDIIKDNYYYVDKSMLIEDILVNRAAVTLFTRPRRFGKTLNMSMIKYFFDVRNKDENRKLFEGLKIFGSEYMKEQGKYPVIFVSLKDLRGDTWEDTFENLKSFISDLYAEFEDMREIMNKRDKIKFDKFHTTISRIKRRDSIIRKIKNSTKLNRMNDIAGTRIIFNNIEDLYGYNAILNSFKFKNFVEVIDKGKNYIENPKNSGYRSIHRIYKYIGNDKSLENKKLNFK